MLFYVNLVKFEIYLTHRKAREALTATSLLQNKPNPVGASQGSQCACMGSEGKSSRSVRRSDTGRRASTRENLNVLTPSVLNNCRSRFSRNDFD